MVNVSESVESYLKDFLTKISSKNKEIVLVGNFNINLHQSGINESVSNFLDTMNAQ